MKLEVWRCESCFAISFVTIGYGEPKGCGSCKGGGAWTLLGETSLNLARSISAPDLLRGSTP